MQPGSEAHTIEGVQLVFEEAPERHLPFRPKMMLGISERKTQKLLLFKSMHTDSSPRAYRIIQA